MAPTADVPVIQVLEREHYFTQALVPLPSAVPYPPLAPSSLRLRSRLIALTTNNFTYAKLGFLFHWWDIHPLPPSTPEIYADAAKYGRISAWGWAEVLESTHDSVPAGSFLWGYHSIGTLAQDVTVTDGEVPGQVLVTDEYRRHMPFYSRYFAATGTAADAVRRDIENRSDGLAYDALVRVMFETAYLMNRYALGSSATSPSAMPGPMPWTAEAADVRNATLVVFAPGSKVGLSFAHELRHGREESDKVQQVVAVASEHSKSFVQGTGLYDAVVSTAESPIDVLSKLGVGKEEKVVLVDFGGRANVGVKWAVALQPVYRNFLMLGVGSEATEVTPADVLAGFQKSGGLSTLVNAIDLRLSAMKLEGEAKYFDGLEEGWNSLREKGFQGLRIRWGTSMEDIAKGWDQISKGELKPEEGLVFLL